MSLRTDWANGESVDADDLNDIGTEVNAKVDKTATITAGTGLTGGGDLSANRTLAVAYGTSGSTACAGNDSRLSDSRTPTAHSHAGTDITSGTVAYARLPVGTAASTIAAGNDSRITAPQAPTSDTTASGSTISTAVTSPRHRSYVTALAAAATIANPTGSPANGWQCIWRIKDNGTDRALTWGSSFRAIGAALPTTTVAGKTLYVPAEYNAADSKWDVFPSAVEA